MDKNDQFDKVIVFGAGRIGKYVTYILKLNKIHVIACFDNSQDMEGQTLWNDIPCRVPYLIDRNIPVLTAVQDIKVKEEIRKQCLNLGYTYIVDVDISRLYQYIDSIPDEEFLKCQYVMRTGKTLNLEKPKTFNEKLQWLKLYDHNPEYTKMADKYEVKKYVADLIGEQYVIPTLGIWDSYETIDFSKLPQQFVLKCTHDSGSVAIIRDKSNIDYQALKEQFEKAMKSNFYKLGREWVYKNIKPRIIAEPYMTDESGYELKDYKIFNFNGKAKMIQVDYDRFVSHKRNLYDTDWKYIEAVIEYPTDPEREIRRPEELGKMLALSEKLSVGIPHVRADFYSIKNRIYFGELTFYHGSGYEKFNPESFELEMGNWLELPQNMNYL